MTPETKKLEPAPEAYGEAFASIGELSTGNPDVPAPNSSPDDSINLVSPDASPRPTGPKQAVPIYLPSNQRHPIVDGLFHQNALANANKAVKENTETELRKKILLASHKSSNLSCKKGTG